MDQIHLEEFKIGSTDTEGKKWKFQQQQKTWFNYVEFNIVALAFSIGEVHRMST
jgi:hypothetical protein